MRFLADAGTLGTVHEHEGRIVLEVHNTSVVLEPEEFAAVARMVRHARWVQNGYREPKPSRAQA